MGVDYEQEHDHEEEGNLRRLVRTSAESAHLSRLGTLRGPLSPRLNLSRKKEERFTISHEHEPEQEHGESGKQEKTLVAGTSRSTKEIHGTSKSADAFVPALSLREVT